MKSTEYVRAVLATLVLVVSSPLIAEPPPLSAYGNLPGIEEVAISPSGQGLAIVGRTKGGERELIVLGSENRRRVFAAGDAKIRNLHWVGEDAVVMVASSTEKFGPEYGIAEYFGALVIPLNADKPWKAFDGSSSMPKIIYGDYGARLVDGKWRAYFSGVQLLGIPTLAMFAVDVDRHGIQKIANGSSNARSWLVDGNGRAAASLNFNVMTGKWAVSNEKGDSLATGSDLTGDIKLVCFGHDGNSVIYGLENDSEGGRIHYYEVPLLAGESKEIMAGIAVERFFTDKTNSRLLGYQEKGGEGHVHLFDPAQQSVIQRVYRAFPKLHVTIAEWTPDFGHVIVHTSGNGDSGSWYNVDMARLRADPIGNDRPTILPALVGQISRVDYRATDGMDMDGILTLPPGREAKNLPVIMLPHDGPSMSDREEFDWLAQAFASRGYAVFQPNFRGSNNRDDAFRRAGYGEWGGKMQSDISDGLSELVRLGIADRNRACIIGEGYGGYAALAGVTLQQGLYKCAISVAGLSDIGDFYHLNVRESGGAARIARNSLRESLGDPRTFDAVSPRKHAAQADAPILLIHGRDDTCVPLEQSDAMADALRARGKPFEMLVLQHEDHWLSHADTREQMLEAAMAFVQKYNPAN